SERSIGIRGARTHNLDNLSLDLPHGRLTVVTGVSGSGKSSLVFDTLYAEGQRRYVQSLSTYARLFLERMERPDVDAITEIPPALALRQKNNIKNARSTVGSITEINDYLRLLFAAVGRTICPSCDREVTRDTVENAAAAMLANPGRQIFLAPFDTGSRSLKEATAYLIENGYHRLHYNGGIAETADFAERFAGNGSSAPDGPLMVVIDRVAVTSESSEERVREALDKSFYLGGGRARVLIHPHENGAADHPTTFDFDRRFNCSGCATAYPEPTPALFSANSPIGACPGCEGFGRGVELDLEKVIPNPNLSLRQGLVAPWRTPAYSEMQQWMLKCARRQQIRTVVSFREMNDEERAWLLDGEPPIEGQKWDERWPGVRGFFGWLERKRYKTHVRILLAKYRRFVPCPACHGAKLKVDALNVLVDGRSITQVLHLSVRELPEWIESLRRIKDIAARAHVILRELGNRVGYLNEVGLGYLTLERQGRTLSGGEAQRIHLASALGSLLSGTLYALDEPTVGLHAGDARRLLGVLQHLRDLGNTVVVVEHDPIMIAGADYLVELGPGGGRQGGKLMHAGAPLKAGLNGNGGTPGRVLLMRALSRQRRFTKRDPAVRITGATENNLRNLSVAIPLGRMVCVTGVSGSGKSTLIETVLYNNYLRRAGESVSEVGACERIEGLDQLGEIVHMGQEMPARSLRSNPATYLKVYDEIRKIFSSIPEARRLGVKARDFSFNVEGGRCDRCHGTGSVTIEMHFMADLEVKCDACDGRRFQSHILGLRYRGKNVNQVLDLTIDEAREFFDRGAHPAIAKRLEPLTAVGLGYLQLGQTTSTLSGGEAQRLKLARFLLADLEPPRSSAEGKPLPRMFLLDEPTTGLASSDIKRLLRVLVRLVAEGNTLVVIEHNLEFIAHADYVIDLGPGGGDEGGRLVVAGDPLAVAANEKSQTGVELRRLFGLPVAGSARVLKSALRDAAET
ncbi:MAG TPA: excinuclease ABC subunit UvrA, partial [Candidatus Binataceae bacterium]|nr:excinuclease ABC subunit UvrA [Candidatus Binataceae bacterium]